MDTAAVIELPCRRADSVRPSLRRVMWAWVFGAGWLSLIGGTPLIRFCEEMGFDHGPRAYLWGLLAAVPQLTVLLQLLGSYWIEWTGRRKPLFFLGNLIHRMLWLVIALLPYLVLPGSRAAVASILGLICIQSAGAQITVPAWTSWMANVVPARVRARYFGLRGSLGQVVMTLLSLLAGWLLVAARGGRLHLPTGPADWAAPFSHWQSLTVAFPISPLHLCSILFAVGAVLGTIDILCFWSVPDPPDPAPARAPRLREVFGAPLRNRHFRWFLATYFAYYFGTVGVGYYFWAFARTELGANDFILQIMFITLPAAGEMTVAPIWGRLISRLGRRRIWWLCMIAPAINPLIWLFITPGVWWIAIVAQVLVCMSWNGAEQCVFNNLLHLASTEDSPSSYQAIFALAVAVAGTLSGLMYAGLARVTGWVHWDVGPFAFRYLSLLFVISATIRLVAITVLLPRMNPKARPTAG